VIETPLHDQSRPTDQGITTTGRAAALVLRVGTITSGTPRALVELRETLR
jgi:hypothetical protein